MSKIDWLLFQLNDDQRAAFAAIDDYTERRDNQIPDYRAALSVRRIVHELQDAFGPLMGSAAFVIAHHEGRAKEDAIKRLRTDAGDMGEDWGS